MPRSETTGDVPPHMLAARTTDDAKREPWPVRVTFPRLRHEPWPIRIQFPYIREER